MLCDTDRQGGEPHSSRLSVATSTGNGAFFCVTVIIVLWKVIIGKNMSLDFAWWTPVSGTDVDAVLKF